MKNIMIGEVFSKINNYFFDADDVCISDFLWFYGIILAMMFLSIVFIFAS